MGGVGIASGAGGIKPGLVRRPDGSQRTDTSYVVDRLNLSRVRRMSEQASGSCAAHIAITKKENCDEKESKE
jgi:hypothetical protein